MTTTTIPNENNFPAKHRDMDEITVEITRLSGSGPRRLGDRYHGVATNGRSLTATYDGRKGGMDRFAVDMPGGGTWDWTGPGFAWLVISYGTEAAG
jgi:hypothetical protein